MNPGSHKLLSVLARLALVVAVVVGACSAEQSSPQLLGKIDFPNSGGAGAQPAFIEGVLYLHNFEYEQAAMSFRRAQQSDPNFALAYWGETMTHHHSIWEEQDRSAGEAVLRRLGRTPEERAAKAPTPREKAYLQAVEILFGTAKESKGRTKSEREILYREAMRRLHENYPDDLEAATFYGLSILGVGKTNRDFATYMRAAAVLMEVWDANRMHPGAAHYLIHAFDDPVHAPLGLPMALAYSKIAPAAAHAQHMTSHIFIALGRWADVAAANERAYEIEAGGGKEWSREASHYLHWLHYAYLQQGRYRQAEALMKTARDRLNDDSAARERAYYGTMFARYVVEVTDRERAEASAPPIDVAIPTPYYHFALAFLAIQHGDLDTARVQMRNVRAGGEGNPEIILDSSTAGVLHKELEALMARANGDNEKAVALLREAVIDTKAMPPAFGPPSVVKPAAELLGDVLFELGRVDEAMAAYTDQLVRTPRRAAALLGLGRAADSANHSAISAEAYRELSEIWRPGDEDVRNYLRIRAR